jgi:hypothetical protein
MRRISTATVLVAGIAALLCLRAALTSATPEPPADRKDGKVLPAATGSAAEKFIPVDTSNLMGSPEGQTIFGVEKAFPYVNFTRPVEFTHAGDGSDRVFVVEQDGRVRVFPHRPDTHETKVFLDLRGVVRREHNEERDRERLN